MDSRDDEDKVMILNGIYTKNYKCALEDEDYYYNLKQFEEVRSLRFNTIDDCIAWYKLWFSVYDDVKKNWNEEDEYDDEAIEKDWDWYLE